MVSTASPVKVKAQDAPDVVGLVEIEYMVVGIGTEQKLELYSYKKGGIYTITVTLTDDDTANGTCTETVQATLKEDPRLKIIRIQMGPMNESLLITGEDAVELDTTCFNNQTKRVVVQVSAPPPGKAKQQASGRAFNSEFGIQPARYFEGYSIVDSNEATAVVNHLKSKGSSDPRFPDEE